MSASYQHTIIFFLRPAEEGGSSFCVIATINGHANDTGGLSPLEDTQWVLFEHVFGIYMPELHSTKYQ